MSQVITFKFDSSALHILHPFNNSVPIQEVECLLCGKAESKGVEVRVVDGHVGHAVAQQ